MKTMTHAAPPVDLDRLVRLEDCSEGWPEHGRKVHLYLTHSHNHQTLCGLALFDVGRSPARRHRFGSFCAHCEKFILPDVDVLAPMPAPEDDPWKDCSDFQSNAELTHPEPKP